MVGGLWVVGCGLWVVSDQWSAVSSRDSEIPPTEDVGWWLEGNKKGAPCERAYKNSNMYLFAFDVRPGGC